MTTFTAHNSRGTYAETLDDLARQLGGSDWTVEAEAQLHPTQRTVLILRRDRHGTHIVDRVIVAQAAIDAQVKLD